MYLQKWDINNIASIVGEFPFHCTATLLGGPLCIATLEFFTAITNKLQKKTNFVLQLQVRYIISMYV